MKTFSKLSVLAINVIVFTGALIFALRSRVRTDGKTHPDVLVGLIFSSVFHVAGWLPILIDDVAGIGALVVSASVLNASVLLQMLIGGMNGYLPSYFFRGACLAEIAALAYVVVYGGTSRPLPERKPLYAELQGVESELERVEKRLASIKSLMKQQGTSTTTTETANIDTQHPSYGSTN